MFVLLLLIDSNTTLLVEAVEQSIPIDVIRSLGSVGVVSVDVVTQSGSAIGQVGPDLHLSHLQSVSPIKYFIIANIDDDKWHIICYFSLNVSHLFVSAFNYYLQF